ncbi:histidine decarboxylase [Saccharothrix sp. S26]|nr:histidine decarboxylase [Saccharothrix sp. S26]
MTAERDRMLGFPVNLEFDYRPLSSFLRLHGNNVGNPHAESDYRIDTKPFEVAVIDFFTDVAGGDRGDFFGYVTSGGTESNVFAAWVARERYPDAVLYASAEAHYSLPKISRLLRMPYVAVPTTSEGTMDTTALAGKLAKNPGRAAAVTVTIGTTGRGAADDLPAVRRTLLDAGVERFRIHSDAAFGGLLAEFGPDPVPWGLSDGADSVAISGHKVVGSPIPCGVVLARAADVEQIRVEGAAVGSDDDTITGSRDALSPLMLWYELRRLGRAGLAERIRRCHETTDYACRRLAELGRNPQRSPGATVVLFDAPPAALCRRWHMMADETHAQLVVMPHVTTKHIDRLCEELVNGEHSDRTPTTPGEGTSEP